MNRRNLIQHMATLSGLAVVTPPSSLAKMLAQVSEGKRVQPNENHVKIRLCCGWDLTAHVIATGKYELPLIDEIRRVRSQLESRGWHLPGVRISDDLRMPENAYVIQVYGVNVFSSVVSPALAQRPRPEVGLADLHQERVIADQLGMIGVQHQYLWPHEA